MYPADWNETNNKFYVKQIARINENRIQIG